MAQDDPGSALIFDKIRTYVKGFENTTPYDCKEDLAEVKVRAGIYINASYILKNDTIIQARVTLLRNVKEKILVLNIHNILWCRQRFESDSEGGDSHILELLLLGQRDPCRLYFVSAHAAFQFVLELKKRVPHLLYGHNEEYEEIFKQNPAHLLAIGKSIMNPQCSSSGCRAGCNQGQPEMEDFMTHESLRRHQEVNKYCTYGQCMI